MCLAADETLTVAPSKRFAKSFGAERAGLLRTALSAVWGFVEEHDLLTPANSSGYSNRTENRLCDGRIRTLPRVSSASSLRPAANPF